MASASSSFTGTESPLSEGGVWVGPSTYWGGMRKATGAGVVANGSDGGVRYNPSTVTFAADHYSEITLKSVPTGGQLYFHYVMCRMNGTAGCYLLTTAADVGANKIQLWRVSDAGAYTQIGTDITLGANMAANDVMRLEIVGTGLTVKYNGSTVRTATDSTFSSGQPAIGGWSADAGSNVAFTASWNAADITPVVDDIGCPVPQRLPPFATPWPLQVAFVDELATAAGPSMVDDDSASLVQRAAAIWIAWALLPDAEGLPSAPTMIDDETAPGVTPRTQQWTAGRPLVDGADLPGTTALVTIDDDSAVRGRAEPPPWGRGRPTVENDLPASLVFPLSVESGGRYLKQSDGTPFLICADTTWSLAVNIPSSGVAAFLTDITGRGFNTVMMNAIEHHYTVVKPPKDFDGNLPFTQTMNGSSYTGSPNGTASTSGSQSSQFAADPYANINNQAPDPTFINNTYWTRVESILSACLARNVAVLVWPMYLGFHGGQEGWLSELVVWDSVIGAGGFTGQGFADPTKSKLWNYGAWLAARWASYPNIIWVAGGDYGSNGQTLTAGEAAAVKNCIDGMKSVAGAQSVLWTAHWDRPCISDDTTLTGITWDLNFGYAEEATAELCRRAYNTAAKPALLGEYFYEDGSFGGSVPYRRYLYWGILGAIGGTFFGHEQLWRFDDGTPGTDYTTLLATTGTLDAARLFAFWKSKAWHRLIPNGLGGIGTLITAGGGTASPQSTDYVAAACTPQGDLLLAYVPPAHTGSVTIAMSKLTAQITARWFDPTNAAFTAIGTFANTGTQAFTTPGNNNAGDADWLLVLETSGAVTIEEISPVQLPIKASDRNWAWWRPWWPYDPEDLPITPTSAIDDHEDVAGLRRLQAGSWLPGARVTLDEDFAPATLAIDDDGVRAAGAAPQPWTAPVAQVDEDFAPSALDEDAPVALVPIIGPWMARSPTPDEDFVASALDEDRPVALALPAAVWTARAPAVDDDLPAVATIDEDAPAVQLPIAAVWMLRAPTLDDDLPVLAATLDEDAGQWLRASAAPWVIALVAVDDDLPAAPPPTMVDDQASTAPPVAQLQWLSAPRQPDPEDFPAAAVLLEDVPAWRTSTRIETGWCAILRQYADDDLPMPAVVEDVGWTFGTGWTVPNRQPPPPDPDDVPIAGPPGSIIDEDVWLWRGSWPLAWTVSISPSVDELASGTGVVPVLAKHVRLVDNAAGCVAADPPTVVITENGSGVVIIEVTHGG